MFAFEIDVDHGITIFLIVMGFCSFVVDLLGLIGAMFSIDLFLKVYIVLSATLVVFGHLLHVITLVFAIWFLSLNKSKKKVGHVINMLTLPAIALIGDRPPTTFENQRKSTILFNSSNLLNGKTLPSVTFNKY